MKLGLVSRPAIDTYSTSRFKVWQSNLTPVLILPRVSRVNDYLCGLTADAVVRVFSGFAFSGADLSGLGAMGAAGGTGTGPGGVCGWLKPGKIAEGEANSGSDKESGVAV
jgi:hypothetical protein